MKIHHQIPKFNKMGHLPEGIYTSSKETFIDTFCNTDYRAGFKGSINDIFDFAKYGGGAYILFGGSFISNKVDPGDLDCLIIFKKDSFIPAKPDSLVIENVKLDIMFTSLEQKDVLAAFIKLFSEDRFLNKKGIILGELDELESDSYILHNGELIEDINLNPYTEEIVRRAYNNRHIIEVNKPKGLLVTIHGLLSNGSWNAEIAPIASSQGWIFAPYIYDNNTPDLLINDSKRSEILDQFRNWIFDLQMRFEEHSISVIAHSFGTYILASYLSKFEEPPVYFNSIILTGSIINTSFDWNNYRGKGVARVRNEIAPNDQWVKYLPNNWSKVLKSNALLGRSGTEGFNIDSPILTQHSNQIFDHNNVIKRDVIYSKWLPYLNANRFASYHR